MHDLVFEFLGIVQNGLAFLIGESTVSIGKSDQPFADANEFLHYWSHIHPVNLPTGTLLGLLGKPQVDLPTGFLAAEHPRPAPSIGPAAQPPVIQSAVLG